MTMCLARPIAFAAAMCAGLLSGCSAPSGPQRVEVFVNTAPPGASCLLSRAGQPIAAAEPTPAIALVEPGADAVTVTCRRPGFQDGLASVIPRAPQQSLGILLMAPAEMDYGNRVDIALVPR
jgi:hypothetical protein